MTKANDFTPAKIKIIRGIVRDELNRREEAKEREEEENQKEMDEAVAESAVTARDWGDL
ncbi:hypothetical protein ACPD8N_00680 [Lacticaseibacillus chiayiensis]|uniref:hypothetical protein n=1 Tax=Lacticaseibacillus chiayiensis TaxID=2100821 RepID=UPI003C71CA2D